jgi:hypothetical protein
MSILLHSQCHSPYHLRRRHAGCCSLVRAQGASNRPRPTVPLTVRVQSFSFLQVNFAGLSLQTICATAAALFVLATLVPGVAVSSAPRDVTGILLTIYTGILAVVVRSCVCACGTRGYSARRSMP